VMQDWVADVNPTNAASVLQIASVSNLPPVSLYFQSSGNRVYTLWSSSNPASGWAPVSGEINIAGSGGLMNLQDSNPGSTRYYRVSVSLP